MLVEWYSRRCTGLADPVIPPICIPLSQSSQTNSSPALRPAESPPTLKRTRAKTDVEGENSFDIQRKKRRLRVDLVTSRLSHPYATPATHIISSRRAQRLGPSARPRSRVHSPLRRAAMLNAIRARKMTAKHIGQREVNLLTGHGSIPESERTEIDLVTEGIRTPRDPTHKGGSQVPPSPSPLGPSNYNAFDEEEDDYDEDEIGTGDEGDSVYSNFNDINGTGTDIEDYDSLCPFGGVVVEDYSRPWKTEGTGGDTGVDMEDVRHTARLPLLHGV
ncbi:MAG: hypothetical protein L6R40_003560 [Gallowayella cf. fulva]|nr:MAG: hypothetical protein L6R40_003560 [Xanthomendoza cf. fulva]